VGYFKAGRETVSVSILPNTPRKHQQSRDFVDQTAKGGF
jgi:hypothetical protein